MNKDRFKEIVYDFNQSTDEALHFRTYKCDEEELQKRIDNLNTIYSVLNSNTGEEEKIKAIFSIYEDIDEINRKYRLLLEKGSYDYRLDGARKALNNYDFIISSLKKIPDNTVKTVIELEKNNYLDNYNYAEFVIKEYISNDKGYFKNMFLRELSIDNDTFDYCVELIRAINPILYKEYEDTVKYYNEKRELVIKEAIMDLYTKIRNGHFLNKTDFECLDFYQELPFKEYEGNCINALKKFINDKMDNNRLVYGIVSGFLFDRKINKIMFVDEEAEAKSTKVIRNIEVDEAVIHNVFRYMDIYDLPRIRPVYRTVLNEYVDGNLDFSNLDALEEKKREEERLVRESYGFKKNPYKLVRRK